MSQRSFVFWCIVIGGIILCLGAMLSGRVSAEPENFEAVSACACDASYRAAIHDAMVTRNPAGLAAYMRCLHLETVHGHARQVE